MPRSHPKRLAPAPLTNCVSHSGQLRAPRGNMQMNAAAIAKALSGRPLGRGRWLVHCPAHSDRNPSLIISDAPHLKDQVSAHCFAGCDWRLVKAKLGSLGLLDNALASQGEQRVSALHPRDSYYYNMRDLALTLWAESQPPIGTPVMPYLASRGLHLPATVLRADAIRFHPHCPFKLHDGTIIRLSAMIALMRDLRTDEARAVHRTALLPDGSGKAKMPDASNPKKMLGSAKGAAVKLIANEDVTLGLGLAEGIETAMTPICTGWLPVWACGSAGIIRAFPVLSGIEHLTIFADADDSGCGVQAARACAQRWQEAGCCCDILLPPEDGTDWNDVGGRYA
jgi:putative DNA primase/helicase